jgi:pentapeptide MXKDX repeat protein
MRRVTMLVVALGFVMAFGTGVYAQTPSGSGDKMDKGKTMEKDKMDKDKMMDKGKAMEKDKMDKDKMMDKKQ